MNKAPACSVSFGTPPPNDGSDLTQRVRRTQSPVWLGSASFDRGVTLSRDTGQVTHKIAPNIDQERDRLIAGLDLARTVVSIYQIRGIGPTLNGRDGQGDSYYTDGEIWMAKLIAHGERAATPARLLPAAALIQVKDKMFSWASSPD